MWHRSKLGSGLRTLLIGGMVTAVMTTTVFVASVRAEDRPDKGAPAKDSPAKDRDAKDRVAKDGAPAPRLALVHLSHGLHSIVPKRDMTKLPETSLYKTAMAVDLDLYRSPNDLIAHRFSGSRLFYVFYKTIDDGYRPQAWAIQRIKKTVREWGEGSTPERETITYQVEVFKVRGGELKRADQHYGSYGLRQWRKREITKEFEIGYGQIKDKAEGDPWPFNMRRLYENVHPYDEDASTYDAVTFTSSRTWTLEVSLSNDGTYAIRSPEFGIDAPKTLPTRATGTPQPDVSSKPRTLVAGRGLKGLKLGTAADRWHKVLGKPLETHDYAVGSRTSFFDDHLCISAGKDGKAKSMYTLRQFAGKTAKGVGLGAARPAVLAAYGKPAKDKPGAVRWSYGGIIFYFDTFDRVRRIVVHANK